jgi:hypothetical protein
MSQPNGGPAFPDSGAHEPRIWAPSGGMTLRDYFAAKCIQGMLADPEVKDMDQFLRHGPKQAYAVADAMLKARGE